MAGDWIKVECSTSRKAEVLRMAEMLGVSRRECMGLLLDYWSWLDANARTESVPNLSRKSLDDVLQCAGLAACLESVGWAKWSDDGWTMTVANYDHHNGSSAKTRAYEQKKKKNQREKVSRICPDELGTREEKRRVTTEREKATPTAKHYELGKKHGVDVDAQWVQYLDWNENAKNKHTNLKAGFSNWIRRAPEFGSVRVVGGKQDARAKTAAQIFGATNDAPSERVIEGERVA